MSLLASLKRRRVLMIVGTLIIAFGSGHLMQSASFDKSYLTEVATNSGATSLFKSVAEFPETPVPPAAALAPKLETPPKLRNRVARDKPLPLFPREEAQLVPQGAPCRANLESKAKPVGMIGLTITANCWPSSQVQIRHSGLNITETLDPQGRLEIDLPALSSIARVEVAYPDSTFGHATLDLPEVEEFYRVALGWEGPQVLTLHALEPGANYGERGHIHKTQPGNQEHAFRGIGGYLTRLGDETGSVAEIYTYPREDALYRGVIRLSAEAEVTSDTCGRVAEAHAIQTDALGGLQSSEVLLSMPGCEALGEIVLLKNLFKDLKLAGR
ncbi:MAG: hypothetical protein ACR2O1_06790 [Boseongicola sp.]